MTKITQNAVNIFRKNLRVGASGDDNAVLPRCIYLNDSVTASGMGVFQIAGIHTVFLQELPK